VQKKIFPKLYLCIERGSTAAYAHAESHGISYAMGWMILRALFCKDSNFGTEQQLDHGAKLHIDILRQVWLPWDRIELTESNDLQVMGFSMFHNRGWHLVQKLSAPLDHKPGINCHTATCSTFKHNIKMFWFSVVVVYGLWILSYCFLGFIVILFRPSVFGC